MKKILSLILLALLPLVSNAYDAEINGIYYNFNGDEAEVTCGSLDYSGSVVIPSSVTYNGKTYRVTAIGGSAFSGCSNLTSVTLPKSLTLYLGEHSFDGCTSLKHIDLTSSLAAIYYCSFRGCTALETVVLPPTVGYLGGYVFSGCTSLKSITIPGGVAEIGYYAFSGCTSLKDVVFEAGEGKIALESPQSYLFDRCPLDSVYLGRSLLYKGNHGGSIDENYVIKPFPSCLKKLCLGANALLDKTSFIDVTSLAHIYPMWEDPTTFSRDRFSNSTYSNAILHVPGGTIEKYQATEAWKEFTNIVPMPMDPDYIAPNPDGYYEIANAKQLAWFASFVKNGKNDANAVLIADIDFTAYPDVMIGSEHIAYQGDFDGAGHTIALDLQRSSNWAGLFCNLSGNVHDLTTFGNITTSAKFAGGIAARTKNAIIERCQSKVNIISSIDGDGTHGGIVGVSYEGTIIRDCLVSGSIFGSQTNCCAGVSGWADGTADGNTNISNCLIISLFSIDTYGSDLLARNSPKVISSNNYFQGDWNAPNNCGNVTVLTKEQVKSGEACVLLNAGRTGDDAVWYQTLDEDNHPVLDNTHKMVAYDDINGYHNPNNTVNEYIINDEMTSFNVSMKGTGGTVVFTHEFSGEWESLYLPFAIDYDAIKADFELAEIDGVVQNDDNNDGIADITVLSIIGFKGQTTMPNTPYLIRAKNAGEQTITFEDITVYPTEEATFDCSSFSTRYEFTGSYNTLSAETLANSYVIQDGELVKGATSLAPCHWYMTATARNGASLNLPNKIRVMMIEDVIDGVSTLLTSPEEEGQVYNLAGQRIVNRQLQNGINIIRYSNGNTRKVLLK